MAENSLIEWTDHTFNPVRGCTKVSPGCANCYAAREALRFPTIRGIWGDSGTRVVAVPSAWKTPLLWNRAAERRRVMELHSVPAGVPHDFRRTRVFCASLADVFEDWKGELRFPADLAPDGYVRARWDGTEMIRELEKSAEAEAQGLPLATMDNLRTELFRLIEATPNLDWQLLTKRPENVMRMVPEHWRTALPRNVWMGTTVEDQQRADERIPELLGIPAAVRFLSCEPLLGPVDLTAHSRPGSWIDPLTGERARGDVARDFGGERIHWVIAGGESGPKARPMHPEWARSLRDQCQPAGVPFLFKQWGEWQPAADHRGSDTVPVLPVFNGDSRHTMARAGKKAAGRMLDGREWNEFPKSMR